MKTDLYEYSLRGIPGYPYAPEDWDEDEAEKRALIEGIELGPDHLELLRALQAYFSRHGESGINARDLHDALDEKFHRKGGMRYLYMLLPKGPIAQGCRFAGLPVPTGAVDRSFGSVQ
jgi:tRNA 2-thiouridine synthesizing protein E